jgi:hypothetical protein
VVIEFVAGVDGSDGTFHTSIGDLSLEQPAPSSTKFNGARAVIGTFTPVGSSAPPYEVHVGNIECDFCYGP